MSLPCNSSGVYGFTLAIVGIFDFTKNVGINSTKPPIKMATVAARVNCKGLFSNQRWEYPSFSFILINAGASASSFATKLPCFAVLYKL